MTTTGYEVHVIKDRRWILAERFPNDSRDQAIAAAKRLFNVEQLDGVRVFTEKFDNATQLFMPQYVMRDVRPGVKVARDAPVQSPATTPPRPGAADTTAIATQMTSAETWRPAIGGQTQMASLAVSGGGSIAAPGAFNPDLYLQTVASGGDPASSTEKISALREAGRRAFETAVLIVGLILEGLGFATLLALLDSAGTTWDERPLWVGLAFGLLLGGLLVVMRQINRLRKLGSWIDRASDQNETLQRPALEAKHPGFNWRRWYEAIFLNKMPSKWPEPEPEPAPQQKPAAQPKPSLAVEPVAEALDLAPEPEAVQPEQPAAPVDHLTGLIAKYIHGHYFDAALETLTDEDGIFAAYLYLIGAANACVTAAGGGSRAPEVVINAAIRPLKLSGATLDDFALRRELFQNDPRYAAAMNRGRAAMETSLETHETDSDSLLFAVAEWRQRAPLSESERLYILAVEASLSMGGTPPEPSAVAHAFEDHRAMVSTVLDIYRGQPLGSHGCAVFHAASDVAAAAMEIQARRFEVNMQEGAAPLDVRTVAIDAPSRRFEIESITQLLAGLRSLCALAIPGDALVSETMRPALTGVGYALREPREVPTLGGEPIRLAAIQWSGAPQDAADGNLINAHLSLAGEPAMDQAARPAA